MCEDIREPLQGLRCARMLLYAHKDEFMALAHLSFRVDAELKARLDRCAKANRWKISQLVLYMLQDQIERYEQGGAKKAHPRPDRSKRAAKG